MLLEGGGFEPPKHCATDLQSAPFGHSGNLPKKRADIRTRTENLLITNQLLCQLSHIGVGIDFKEIDAFIRPRRDSNS